jgi:acetyltransferase-like isoleucine patch superfamily enzyme
MYSAYVRVHPSAIIAPGAAVRLLNPPSPPRICLEIGEGCHIFSSFSLLRPEARIVIGPRCQLGASNIVAKESVTFEGDTLMAWGVTVIDTDAHSIDWEHRQYDVERCRRDYIATNGLDLARTHDWSTVRSAPVVIGAKTWIGFNSIILRGVRIGEGAVIGAGSVVTKDVSPWHVAAGNPCRTIRPITPGR